MAASPSKFDYVVVLMFENRSFDNLLGYLYSPGEVPAFEGVRNRNVSNPIPSDVNAEGVTEVGVHPATSMDTPDPDPGEEYPHINTQLFGTVSPSANQLSKVDDMKAPFNSPPDPSAIPPMDGFVADYINTFQVEMGHLPSYNDFAQVMACYTPDQIPVFSTLAREFACFDHWFCEVPSQTNCNRSFFHAASSSGLVLNAPPGSFATLNDAPTIFERLEARHRTWKVYSDPRQILPATALIHACRLAPYFATHFRTIFDFYHDAREGQLPDYSFIEPNMLHPHTDMHPPGAAKLRRDLHLPAPQSMAGGEQLLARVYDAVRTSSSSIGSNWQNTLLLVTFDEHGGIHDHVPPPPAPPPGDSPRHQQDFQFNRSGVRVPTIVISAWVNSKTVITQEYRSTSLIRTLRERWTLGGPLTARDSIAPDIAPILTRTTPRPPDEWPQVHARPLSTLAKVVEDIEHPLSRLEKDIIGEALAYEAATEGRALDIDVESLSRKQALTHLSRIQGKMFPGIASGRMA